jgi:hypothetical protein
MSPWKYVPPHILRGEGAAASPSPGCPRKKRGGPENSGPPSSHEMSRLLGHRIPGLLPDRECHFKHFDRRRDTLPQSEILEPPRTPSAGAGYLERHGELAAGRHRMDSACLGGSSEFTVRNIRILVPPGCCMAHNWMQLCPATRRHQTAARWRLPAARSGRAGRQVRPRTTAPR